MRRQIGATILTIAMARSLMAGCSSGSGETTAAATEAAKEEPKEEAEDEAKDEAKDTSAEAENTGSEERSRERYVIGLAMSTQTNPFFVDIKNGVQKTAGEYGIELYTTDVQDDPTVQMRDVENLITKKPGAIIIDTCDSDAIVSSIEAYNDTGIPVSTMDHKASDGEVISHISHDAIRSGHMAGRYLVDALGGKDKIVEIQGIVGTNVAQDRSQDFNEVVKDNPDVEIATCQMTDSDRAKGMSVVENILRANPGIDGLYAASDEMPLDALEAMAVSCIYL